MAKTKRSDPSRVPGANFANLAKKSRRSTSSAKSTEVSSSSSSSDEEDKPQVTKKSTTIKPEQTAVKASSAVSTATTAKPLVPAANTQVQLGGDNLALLKERFNSLHEVRFTEPEKQCTDLLKLVEEQKSAHEQLVKKLESRIASLEQQTKDIGDLRKREKQLLEENATVRAEVESVRKSLELADKERAVLVKALENVDDSAKDNSALEQLVALLDAFKALTGVTLNLDEEDPSKGKCTIYNQKAKKGVRFALSFSGQKVTFTPAANKNLLPPEMRNQPTELLKEDVPVFVARVVSALFH